MNMNEIDELSRGSLGNLEKEPPPMSFDKIRKRVLWYSIWSLGVGTFMRRFWMVPAAASIFFAAGYLFFALMQPDHSALTAFDTTNQNTYSTSQKLATSSNSSHTPLNPIKNSDIYSYKNSAKQTDPSVSTQPNVLRTSSINENTESAKNKGIDPGTAITLNANSNQIKEGSTNNAFLQSDTPDNADEGSNSNVRYNLMSGNSSFEKLTPKFQLIAETKQTEFCELQSSQSNKKSKRIGWSFMAGVNSGYSGSFYSPVTENQTFIKRQFSAPINPTLELRSDFGKWFLSAGLQQTIHNNRYHADKLLYNENSSYELSLSNQFWNVDTTGYWHYTYVSDTIIHVQDSVWEWNYDSLLVQQFDSVEVTSFDTLNNAHWKRDIKLIEIPLMAGRIFYFNRFVFSLSAGLGLGMIYQTSGEMYAGQSAETPFLVYETQKKPSVSFISKGSVAYLINERFALEIAPWYRCMITSVNFPEESDSRKPWSAGLSAGLRIFF